MEKPYKYRKHLRYMQYIVPGMMAGFIILTWGVFLFLNAKYNTSENSLGFFMFAFIISGVFFVEGLIAYFFLRRFSKIEVILKDDEIIYKNIKEVQVIPIDEIVKLEFPSIRYAGGWVKIISKKTSIRLTVVVEGIGDLLKNLKDNLDSKGVEGAYSPKGFYSFYKTAEYSDQSWARMYEVFSKGCLAIFINAVIGIVAAIFGNLTAGGNIFLITASVVGPIFIYIIAEIILGRKIAKESKEEELYIPQRDKSYESKVYKITGIVYVVVYIIFLITYMI